MGNDDKIIKKDTTKESLTVLEEMVVLAEKNAGDLCDKERDHRQADELLLQRLVQLNETRIVAEYLRIKKWYS